jgi:hypothetical protein
MTALWDDEDILLALRDAVRARQEVPADFVTAGKSAFAWHNIDAELAQLTYDSQRDLADAAAVRTEAASIRALTFTSARLTIELEVTQDALVGQIVPAQTAVVKIRFRSGGETDVTADEIGCFTIEPIPIEQFRLECRTADGIQALTGWVAL